MAHRILLTDRQRSALFDLPTDEASILKHYTWPMTISNISARGGAPKTGSGSRFSSVPCGIRADFCHTARSFPKPC